MVGQFLKQIPSVSSNNPLRFPDTLDQIYSRAIGGLRQEFPDIDQCHYSLDDDSNASVACQLYKLFPSHCLKFLQALSITELEAWEKGGETEILGWPSVTLVDIGCGAGAASAALLALLQGYQQFLAANGKPISPIQVLLIGFDPSANMLELYDRIIGEYSELLSPWLIQVQHRKLAERFPQGVMQLTRQFQPIHSHFVLLAMSNVIRPLRHSFQAGYTPMWERIRRALGGEPDYKPGFGAAESRAIKLILDNWGLDQVGLLCIATAGKDDSGTAWHTSLGRLTQVMRNSADPHIGAGKGVRARKGWFENPPASWWRRCQNSTCFPTRYYFNYSVFIHESFAQDKQWQSITSPENIELAWARARRYALHEVLADEIEILLFDYDCEGKLDRLRKWILCEGWEALNVGHTLLFDAPKKPGETRPKTVARIEEQILGAAAIQHLGANVGSAHASYSYRLNDQSDEFLYEYWLFLWKRFLEDTHKNAAYRCVLQSDVQGFYQNIVQKDLVDVVKRVLSISGRTERLLHQLLLRDCGPRHAPGKGLPQGNLASGFWADIYIGQLDGLFSKLPGVTFARYADDMVFAIDDKKSDPDEIEKQLRIALDQLGGLVLSEDKTYKRSGSQYVDETGLDDQLGELQEKRFDPLVGKVYRLNIEYRRLFRRDEWEFATTYRRLLRSISIYASTSWLRRKIEQNSYWANWLFVSKLRFPPFPDPSDADAEDKWAREFVTLNPQWTEQIDQLRRDLANLCRESIAMLSSPNSTETEQNKAGRRLKFAAYRLCILGMDKVAELLATEIAQHSCRVPVHLLCRGLADCGRSDLLIQVLDASDSAFVRACAIRALAEVPPTPPVEAVNRMWAMLTQDSSTLCEKLKASEALLFADKWDTANFAHCQRLVEQENDPYLLKNYVLIMNRAFGDAARDYLQRLQEDCGALIVTDAVQYTLHSSPDSLVHKPEPDALLRYYSDSYPTAESDTKEIHSPFGWVF